MKTQHYARIRLTLFNLALFGMAVAFAQTAAVGPRPDQVPERDYVGTLVVYSATTERPDGDDTTRYPHTPYEIFQNGHLVKKVYNGQTTEDEMPTRVTLHRGHYIVVAESETEGTVRIPVTIETGSRTTLHLERPQDWKPDATPAEQADLVRLPNGQPIGYRNR